MNLNSGQDFHARCERKGDIYPIYLGLGGSSLYISELTYRVADQQSKRQGQRHGVDRLVVDILLCNRQKGDPCGSVWARH